ncbi:MAG: pro-sigmaK processing inhibitor BofA family protein [Clostridia bacterium]|nr:pro-sigmaK processing inhibitor BofA family protein [Clostridia bacterium]
MNAIAIIAATVLSVFAAIILFFHIKSRRPLRSAAINALLGLAALVLVNAAGFWTGVRIPINIYTLPAAAVFGLPACAAFVVLGVLFL